MYYGYIAQPSAYKPLNETYLASLQNKFSHRLAPITQWTAAASCLHGKV